MTVSPVAYPAGVISGVLVTTFSTCRSIAGSLTAPASVKELLSGLPSLAAWSVAVLLSWPGGVPVPTSTGIEIGG